MKWCATAKKQFRAHDRRLKLMELLIFLPLYRASGTE
jgi:hypothetical protein